MHGQKLGHPRKGRGHSFEMRFVSVQKFPLVRPPKNDAGAIDCRPNRNQLRKFIVRASNMTSTCPTPMEVEPAFQQGPPRRQISNVSLPKTKSEISGASSNLVNSIVGAGIIGIPFAFKQSGLIAGVALLFLVSYFTGMSPWSYVTQDMPVLPIESCMTSAY